MKKVGYLGNMDLKLSKGEVAAERWNTNEVKVIPMKDGYKVATDVTYYDEKKHMCTETCEILLSDSGVPYVDIGTGMATFTEENCRQKVSTKKNSFGGIDHEVEGYYVWSLNDGRLVPEDSMFDIVGKCTTVRKGEYFHGLQRSAILNNTGLSLIVEYVQDPKNKAVMDKRTNKATPEGIEAVKNEIRATLEKVMNGEESRRELDMMLISLKEIEERAQPGPIEIKLDELELLRELKHGPQRGQ